MSIENTNQLLNTREKLQELESLYSQTQGNANADDRVRELTLRSLRNRINQFKEEIARYETHTTLAVRSG